MSATAEVLALQETLYTSKNPTRRWLHCTRRDWVIDALRRTKREGMRRAAEIGPGSGVYLPVLAELYDEVVATDIDEAFLDRARELARAHPNIRALADDVTASSLPDAHLDLLLCSEVVEHIRDSQTALREMRRVLRPGGVLVLSTPLKYSPLEQASKIAFLPGVVHVVRRIYGEPVLKQGHVNLMTEREVRAQLAGAGFRVVEHHKSGFYLPLVAEFGRDAAQSLLARMERRLRNGPLSGLLWTQYYVAIAEG